MTSCPVLIIWSRHERLAWPARRIDIVYRGFLQPAFIGLGGVGPGLWTAGMLFGLVHWGLSVGILAALPVSLLIGLGAVAWGKAAYETRGLSWPIAAHFLIDIAVMGAYFI